MAMMTQPICSTVGWRFPEAIMASCHIVYGQVTARANNLDPKSVRLRYPAPLHRVYRPVQPQRRTFPCSMSTASLVVPSPAKRTCRALYHFVYCSRAAEGIDDAQVGRIVEVAQRHNLARGITGVLVFGSGIFFQWIEGPAAQMKKLIASLHRDPRHYDLVALDQSEEERERLYPTWDMERVEADELRIVLQDALESAEDRNNAAALRQILMQLDTAPLHSLGRK